MTTCRNGHPNDGEPRFCLTCGALLGTICPAGHASAAADGTCDVCGLAIEPDAPAAEPAAPGSGDRADPSPTSETPAGEVEAGTAAASAAGGPPPVDGASPPPPGGSSAEPVDDDRPPGVPRFIAPIGSPQPSAGIDAPWVPPHSYPPSSPPTRRWVWAVVGALVATLIVMAMVVLTSSGSGDRRDGAAATTTTLLAPVVPSEPSAGASTTVVDPPAANDPGTSTTTGPGSTSVPGGTVGPAPSSPTKPKNPTGPVGGEGNPLAVGTVFRANDWLVQVLGYEPDQDVIALDPRNPEPTPDFAFVRMKVRAAWVGEGQGDPSTLGLVLVDDTGGVRGPRTLHSGPGDDPIMLADQDPVPKGGAAEGFLYYQIPESSELGRVTGYAPAAEEPGAGGPTYFLVHEA